MANKILFVIDSLGSGGRERRFLELINFLYYNTEFKMQIVLTESEIHYNEIYDFAVPVKVIKRNSLKWDPMFFFKFQKIASDFKPDIIHTWSIMTTFYAIPSSIFLNCPLISNLVSNAKVKFRKFSIYNLFFKIDCFCSNIILSNSNAGSKAYGLDNSKKSQTIYNGVSLDRFNIDKDLSLVRKEIGINTKYLVIMVASFSHNKDYDFFLDVAKEAYLYNKDITFVGVGDGELLNRMENRIINEKIRNVILTGVRNDIEILVAASDIGVLFSNSEGISNSIIEYMALGKPVITTDRQGGSCEIVDNEKSGYIMDRDLPAVLKNINKLLENSILCKEMGEHGRRIIINRFTIENMSNEFLNIYSKYLNAE